jgi:glycosyltransferase involved in cell wall biosynthesis
MGLRRLDPLRRRWDPLLRATYQQASYVLGLAPYVRDLLAAMPVQRFGVMLGPGISELPRHRTRRANGGDVRLLFVGRIVRTKGTRDAIRALGLARDLPASLDVVGDGFDRAECEGLVRWLGLADRVRFHGWLPRPQVEEFYRSANVFVFPSYREPAGGAALEAMSHGLPLLVSDRGGPGFMVDEACGVKVSPHAPEQYARDLAGGLIRLVTEPALRIRLGAGARQKAADIGLWQRKTDQLSNIYDEILATVPAQNARNITGAGR